MPDGLYLLQESYMSNRSRRLACAACASIVAFTGWGHGAEFTWTGSGSGAFSDPAEWNPAGPPGAVDRAVFRVGDTINFTSSPSNNNAFVGIGSINVLMTQTGDQTWTLA